MISHAVLALCGFAMAFPFLWMVITALKTQGEALQFPPTLWPASPQWANFSEAWSAAPFGTYFFNTAFVSLTVTACVMTTALFAGYAFGTMEFPGRQTMFVIYLATMMVPFEVILIPNFLTIEALGWIDQYPALIVPWAANVFSVFLVTQLFRTLPKEYFEAAQLDGASHWQFLWAIGRPLAMPALATAGLFAFLGSWNSLLWPLLVTSTDTMRTVEVGLSYFRDEQGTQFHLLMAASALAIAPVLIVFLMAQRTFIEGVSAGVKG